MNNDEEKFTFDKITLKLIFNAFMISPKFGIRLLIKAIRSWFSGSI